MSGFLWIDKDWVLTGLSFSEKMGGELSTGGMAGVTGPAKCADATPTPPMFSVSTFRIIFFANRILVCS